MSPHRDYIKNNDTKLEHNTRNRFKILINSINTTTSVHGNPYSGIHDKVIIRNMFYIMDTITRVQHEKQKQ